MIKEQQQSPQKTQEHRQKEQEKRGAAQKQTPQRLPAQQFAQLLRQQDSLPELPVPLLRDLAQIVGNSSLTDLMRGDGDGAAVVCAPEEPEGETDLPPNWIRTSPPRLTVPPEWDAAGGQRPPPVRPRTVRDRGRRPEVPYAEISDRGSG